MLHTESMEQPSPLWRSQGSWAERLQKWMEAGSASKLEPRLDVAVSVGGETVTVVAGKKTTSFPAMLAVDVQGKVTALGEEAVAEGEVGGFATKRSRLRAAGIGVHAGPAVLPVDPAGNHARGRTTPADERGGVVVVADARFPGSRPRGARCDTCTQQGQQDSQDANP
mgnify:CR=1 FL=1